MKTSNSSVDSETLVFIVDDEPCVGEVAEFILQGRGFRTKLFSDPKRALKSLSGKRESPSVLLTDFQMNGMNGLELIECSKRILPKLKTVLYSGNVEKAVKGRFSVSPDRIVSKPFLPQTLVNQIESLLGA